MNWIFRLSFMNMKIRMSRTILTLLGVTIGVVSVVSLLSIGLGMKNLMLSEFEDESTIKQITVSSPGYTKKKDLLLTDKTIKRLSTVDYVEDIYPVLSLSASVDYGKYMGYFDIKGVPQNVLENMDIADGSVINYNSKKPELVVGNRVGALLFNLNSYTNYEDGENKRARDMVGDKLGISIYTDGGEYLTKFKIAGCLLGDDNSYTAQSQEIYCNQEALIKYLKMNKQDGKMLGQPTDENNQPLNELVYSNAIITVDELENVDFVVKKLQDMGFATYNEKEYLESAKRQMKLTQLLLAGIGAIALIVAVIGISNTMTTSVYDRVKDIGTLKVLGCDTGELLGMFLFEAGAFGLAGGLLGTGISFAIKGIINKLAVTVFALPTSSQISIIPAWLVAGTIVLSTVFAVFAGYIPARWGSKLSPIEAVRR